VVRVSPESVKLVKLSEPLFGGVNIPMDKNAEVVSRSSLCCLLVNKNHHSEREGT